MKEVKSPLWKIFYGFSQSSKPQNTKIDFFSTLLLSLEEGNVEEGSVEVEELKEVHLDNEVVVKVSLSTMKLCSKMIKNKVCHFFFFFFKQDQ